MSEPLDGRDACLASKLVPESICTQIAHICPPFSKIIRPPSTSPQTCNHTFCWSSFHADRQAACRQLLFAVLQGELHSDSDMVEEELNEEFDEDSEGKDSEQRSSASEESSSSQEESAFINTGRRIC